jgi:tripartite-type tricarboxylate transporter receptor subunit TctC
MFYQQAGSFIQPSRKLFGKLGLTVAIAGAILSSALTTTALAAGYPSKPVTLIVPYKAGGSTETMAQVFSKALGKALGAKVIVKTRPGGGGAVGATFISQAKSDGYTIMFTTLTSVTGEPLLKPQLTYTHDSFTYISGVTEYQMAFISTPDKPYKNLDELIAFSRNGKTLNVADQGGLSKSFINFLAKKEGVSWTAIPTRGGGEMVPFLLGNKVDFAYSGGVHQKYGEKMSVLASALPHRLAAAPDVPSLQELYGISMPGNAIIAGPEGLPDDVVMKLESSIQTALNDPDFEKILTKLKFPKAFISNKDMQKVVADAVKSLKSVLATK